MEQYFSKRKDDRLGAMAQIIGIAVGHISSMYIDIMHTSHPKKDHWMEYIQKSAQDMGDLWREHYDGSELFYNDDLKSQEETRVNSRVL